MAAHDYFNTHPSNQYLAEPPSYSNPGYAQSPYSSQSPNLSPVRSQNQLGIDRIPSYHTTSPGDLSPASHEQIPLKQTPKIQTNATSWPIQDTTYPMSPNAHTPADPTQRQRRRRSKKKKGFFAGPIPWVVYTMTLVQLTVFIVEIVRNSTITGSPIMIHPQFNPMIGPSTYVLINMGARFVPCMRTTIGVQDAAEPIFWPCPNTLTLDPNAESNKCSLAQLCGLSGLDYASPNQWYRFIVPIFLHAGVIHIGFNMLLQLTMGREMERIIGSIRFALVYFSSGIFGFVLGGNFAATAIASTGASGCLFGILALVLLDLLYSWQERESPVKDLMWILCDIVISFVLGLLPGLDNFSHIGGFLMGLACGVCILHSPKVLRQRIGDLGPPYQHISSSTRDARARISMTMSGGLNSGAPESPISPVDNKPKLIGTAPGAVGYSQFAKKPVGFFKNRKPLWWAWWLIRAGALIGVLVAFVVLLTNFYKYRTNCSWCKYLSCLPINNWCELGNLNLQPTTTNGTSNARRDELLSTGLGFVAGR